MSSTLLDLLVLIIISDSLQHDIWITHDTVLLTRAGEDGDANEE